MAADCRNDYGHDLAASTNDGEHLIPMIVLALNPAHEFAEKFANLEQLGELFDWFWLEHGIDFIVVTVSGH